MDVVLSYADSYVLTPYVYPDTWREDDPWRQIASLEVIVSVGAYLLYFTVATLNYCCTFDKRLLRHPLFLKNQIQREILCTVISVPFVGIPTGAIFFLEVKGYSKLYDNVGDTRLGYAGVLISMLTFIAFTDMVIYWTHRLLHHKRVYKNLHKIHHNFKVPTPFASHAFHPLDGFMQSLPYHIYPFLFPLHKVTYLGLFVFVNIWTVSIHDGNYGVPESLKSLVNGSAHHMDHHLYYNYNYGQFFTLWDRIGGSYRYPSSFEGCGPIDQMLAKETESALK
ncbi:unnamed protein product, partial [Lymnaea stagnalis]